MRVAGEPGRERRTHRGSGRRLAAAPPPAAGEAARERAGAGARERAAELAGAPPAGPGPARETGGDPDRAGAPPTADTIDDLAGPPAVWLLFDRATVRTRVAELGAELRADYRGVEPILVTVLRGGVIFLADLIRAAAMPCKVDFMAISRFDASEETGVVRIVKDLDLDLSGAHVLVVEDVVDTGLTLTYLLRVLAARGPASLRVCALLDKRARRIVDVPLSYVGFEVPDVYVVGYGLDLDERERGRGEILAVNDLAAVRRDPALLDRPAEGPG
jgi:hypoxanthine phosphoribosyltransferase